MILIATVIGAALGVAAFYHGWKCTKTSIQMLYSIVTLTDMNIGELQRLFGLLADPPANVLPVYYF